MSSTSFRDKELPLRLKHPLPIRIETVEKKLSSQFPSCSVLRHQQKQPIKSKVSNQSENRRAFLAIESNSTGPRCFEVQKAEATDLSWSSGKHSSEQQGYTKRGKSREFDSANLNGVWSNRSVNEDDTYSLTISLQTGSPNYCNISSERGPSILFQQDLDTHENVAAMIPRNVTLETKSKPLNQHETVSMICLSEELRNDFRNCDDFKNHYSQTEHIDSLYVGRYPPHYSDPRSLSFTTIRRTKRTREQDESIASDMITHGMPSLLSTTSGEHYLPMALSSHTSNNTNKQFKGIPERPLVSYNANVFLPWRLQNMSTGSLHELKTTKEALDQLQQGNVHPCISLGSNGNAAFSLKVTYKGSQELERPLNFNSVDSRMQFFITPAPETLKSLETTIGLEDDAKEPIVKIPNYFLDFISEDRPNDHSAPKLGLQQGCSSCDKANWKSVENVAKKDMNAGQTKMMPQQSVTMKTKVLRLVKPSKTRVVSSLEKAADIRHFTFSSNYSEGHASVPTPQVNASVSNTTVTEIPLQVRTWPDAYQGKVPILTLPLNSDNVMISTCTQTSSAARHSAALSLSKRKYQCEVCGRSFSRSNTLITHNRIHTGDRPFPCDVCGRAFRQLGNLTRHKMTHAAVKPHTCPICRKCFSRTSNLNTHMRTHTNYKPFVCDFCGKGFHQKVDMKIHRYTHTGEKPHKCNKCGRGFKQLTHLKYHMRTHSTFRLYKCEHCGKGFNQKGNLQAHLYGHTGKRPHRCEICGKGFTLTSTLNTHKRTHAPHKPFKCKYCEKAFYQKNALKTHYISSHPCTNGVCLL